jgi:hypothetical protein
MIQKKAATHHKLAWQKWPGAPLDKFNATYKSWSSSVKLKCRNTTESDTGSTESQIGIGSY